MCIVVIVTLSAYQQQTKQIKRNASKLSKMTAVITKHTKRDARVQRKRVEGGSRERY